MKIQAMANDRPLFAFDCERWWDQSLAHCIPNHGAFVYAYAMYFWYKYILNDLSAALQAFSYQVPHIKPFK